MNALLLDDSEQRLTALLVKVADLAVLPHVVFKVLEISAESADTAGIEMEKAIIIDPGFSSRILIQANSAAYGLPRKLVSIKETIAFLGYRAIRNVAMTVGVFDLFLGKTDRASLRRRTWWRQSLDCAVCSRWLARELRAGYPEEAYTCGLLHLMGKTLLDKLGEGDYSQVEELVAEGLPVLNAEERVYGVNHVQLSVAATRKWRLSEDLIQGLHYVAPINEGPIELLSALTAVSVFISGRATEGWDGNLENPAIPVWALQALKVPIEKFEPLVHAGLAVIAASGRDE